MGEEVLDFLRSNGLDSYAVVFANHDVDTLAMVAALRPEQVRTCVYAYAAYMFIPCVLFQGMPFSTNDLNIVVVLTLVD